MGNCVRRFGEVQAEDGCLLVIVRGGIPISNCFHELGLTEGTSMEFMLLMDDKWFHVWLRKIRSIAVVIMHVKATWSLRGFLFVLQNHVMRYKLYLS